MKTTDAARSPGRRRRAFTTTTVAVVFLLASAVGLTTAAVATPASLPAPVDLGTAAPFAVLAGSTVTNTGPSVITGDLGVSPGTAVTGFPPGSVTGTIHSADAVAAQAKLDLTTAYLDAAGRVPDDDLTG